MDEPTDPDHVWIVDELAAEGVMVRSLSDIAWQHPHPDAIPVLLKAIDRPIDGWTKMLALGVLGKPWAARESFPHILRIFNTTDFTRSWSPQSVEEHRRASFDENVVARIAHAPAKDLWPQILEYARRPDLGYMAAFFLRRAGKFRTHADEVLMLYDELVGSDWKAIEVSIAEGLRLLGDPRGVAILMRVKDHNSTILREKARTLDRLQGRD